MRKLAVILISLFAYNPALAQNGGVLPPNTVLAGPPSGAPGFAAPRALVSNDISGLSPTFGALGVTNLASSGTSCVQASPSGVLSLLGAPCGTGSGNVTSVSNSDSTLTISPTSGAVVASLNLSKANTWLAAQTFPAGSLTGTELANGTVANVNLANMPADTAKCNNTGSPAAPADCTTIVVKDYVSLASPSSFWSNQATPSNGISYGDKLLGGDFINNPNTVTAASNVYNATCSTGDWFSNFEATTSNLNCGYWPGFAMVVAAKNTSTSVGNITSSSGILGAGQTLNSNFGGAFGVMGFALNNNVNTGTVGPAGAGGAWAGYFECDVIVNATHGGCIGVEIEAGNFVSDAYSLASGAVPSDPFGQGFVNSLQLGCGSGLATPTPFKCAAAAQIVDVGNQFRVGINVINGSIAPQSIFGGTVAIAMAMPEGYGFAWYSAANTAQGGIEIDGTNSLILTAPTINLAPGTSLKISGTLGVTCAPGTVNGATIAFQNGIAIHC